MSTLRNLGIGTRLSYLLRLARLAVTDSLKSYDPLFPAEQSRYLLIDRTGLKYRTAPAHDPAWRPYDLTKFFKILLFIAG